MANFGRGGTIVTNPVFVVTCERIAKKALYKVIFLANNQLNDRIKALPSEQRAYSVDDHCWHIHTRGLYEIIKRYKRSEKIKFEFGIQGRQDFLAQIKKLDELEIIKVNKIQVLKMKNAEAIAFKEELEKNYKLYESKVLNCLKEGITLYPHQVVGTMFLQKVKSGLLSLQMGLGKTLISIAFSEMMEFKKVFVITPNSLKFNYFDEVEKFSKDSKPYILNYKDNKYTLKESKYVIVNYDYFNGNPKKTLDKKLNKKIDKVKTKFLNLDLGFIECVICDESHLLKNTDANTYKNFKRLFKEIPCKIFLSGTPAPNFAKELYTVLNQISPLDFPTKAQFYEQYCGLVFDPEANRAWGETKNEEDDSKDKKGAWVQQEGGMRLEELFYKITPYTYRKRKVDVLKDLPDKIYNRIVVEMTPEQLETYNKIEEGVANEIFSKSEMSSINALTIMLRLRQYTSLLKIDAATELTHRLLDEGEKVVIVDMFKPPLLKLYEKIGDKVSVLHTGDQNNIERNNAKKNFQDPNGKAKVFIASIATTKYGLTLTAASKLFMTSLPFSVGEYDQVSDRLHRIGQKDTVFIYPIIIKDSIDEHIFRMIEKKRKEINKVMDNEDYKSNVDESVLSEVLAFLKRKYKK